MTNQLLTTKNIEEIISSKYNEKNSKPFELIGFNIPKHKSTIKNTSEEKRLQWLTNLQFELILNQEIIEEDYLSSCNGQNNGYILEEELLYAINQINKNSIKNISSKNTNYSPEEISKLILQNFIDRYNNLITSNSYKNIKLYNLFFDDQKNLMVTVNGKKYRYAVIDKENKNINKIKIIKEKKLLIGNTHEQPDFAIYFNGLPFFIIEMKQTQLDGLEGTRKALQDYRRKKSYHNFLCFVGTNADEVFMSASPNASDFFIWEDYEEYDDKNPVFRNGFFDLISELLTSPKNILFYFNICTMPSEDNDYLKIARVQQYQTTKKFQTIFANNLEAFSYYFQHHTRTGKSYTFKLIANLAYNQFNHRFKKIIFFTHDISSVLPSVKKEFQNIDYLPEGQIQVIESKKDYKKVLSSKNIFNVYIVNMQKISKSEKALDTSSDILIFIDEVHTHQSEGDEIKNIKTMADLRKKHFPNASIIAATATPTIEEYLDPKTQKTVHINLTEQLYGKCVDLLTPADALRLKLVTPLSYFKSKYSSQVIDKFIKEEQNVDKKIMNKIISETLNDIDNLKENTLTSILRKNKIEKNVIDYFKFININKYNYSSISDFVNKYKIDTENFLNLSLLLDNLQKSINNTISSSKRDTKDIFEKSLWEFQLRDKINEQVIPILKDNKKAVQEHYDLKAFYIVPNRIENGKSFLRILKDMIQNEIDKDSNYNKDDFNIKNNIYKGVRFGFDNNEDETLELNGDLGGKEDITALFEVDEVASKAKTKAVDVLILVRKKLMGYDNKELTIKFLDRIIRPTNIKEMLQISTRGTTKREGKSMGIIIDLTFSNENIETFQKAFSIYNKKDIEAFIFNQEEIDLYIEHLTKIIKKFKTLFIQEEEFNDKSINNIFDEKNLHNLFEFLKTKYWLRMSENNTSEDFLNQYFELNNEMNKYYKKLISPQYVLDINDEKKLHKDILSVYKMDSYLLNDIKSKESNVTKKNFSIAEINRLLEESFFSFGGVNNFINKMEISFDKLEEIKINSNPDNNLKKKMNSQISKLLKEIKKHTSINSSSILASLEAIQLFIDTNQKPIEAKEKELNGLEKLLESKKAQRKKDIENEFNNNEGTYEIYQALDRDFKSFFIEDYQNILKIYSESLFEVIEYKISSFSSELSLSDKLLILLSDNNGITLNITSSALKKIKENDKDFSKLKEKHKEIFGSDQFFDNLKKELNEDLNNSIELENINNPLLTILSFALQGR